MVSPQRIVASGEKSIGPLIIHPEMNDRNTLAYQSITTRLLPERADTDREKGGQAAAGEISYT